MHSSLLKNMKGMSSWFLKLANFNMVNPKIWLKISNSYSGFFIKYES